MKLEELSDKELAILEVIDKGYAGIKSIAKRTENTVQNVIRIMENPTLLRRYREKVK